MTWISGEIGFDNV